MDPTRANGRKNAQWATIGEKLLSSFPPEEYPSGGGS